MFQFHKVRLKANYVQGSKYSPWFQFHKVRLKEQGKKTNENYD